MSTIRVFVTGGTFDKEYDELSGKLYFKDTHLSEMLELGRCKLHVDVGTLMMIDSLDMQDSHRAAILAECAKAAENRIVITHGTDTMENTARVLGEAVHSGAIQEKTIVLTGAMVPYKFGSSDGLFNLGSALAFVQSLPKGVYIAMNGMIFPWDNVTKDRQTGRFKPIR
jgi:L-asparaginase